MLMMTAPGTASAVPYTTSLEAGPVGPADGLSFLMLPDEKIVQQFITKAGGETVFVSERRIVWLDERGGMLGKRLETFSLRLNQVTAFYTAGAGGMAGEQEIKLIVTGIGEIILGFTPETDISGLVGHLTRFAGS
jgi:hypothetical protein